MPQFVHYLDHLHIPQSQTIRHLLFLYGTSSLFVIVVVRRRRCSLSLLFVVVIVCRRRCSSSLFVVVGIRRRCLSLFVVVVIVRRRNRCSSSSSLFVVVVVRRRHCSSLSLLVVFVLWLCCCHVSNAAQSGPVRTRVRRCSDSEDGVRERAMRRAARRRCRCCPRRRRRRRRRCFCRRCRRRCRHRRQRRITLSSLPSAGRHDVVIFTSDFVQCRQNDTQICCVGDSFFMCRVAADMQFWANLPTFLVSATCRRHVGDIVC